MKITFFSALFLVFLTLKLTGIITWSWVWVTAPLWLTFIVIFVIVFFVGICKEIRGR
jgi:hypothetical protein